MTEYKTILLETHGRVGLVRLNRPEALNAINTLLITELMAALETWDADEAIGAMVITGNEKAFAAGADIKEMADASAAEMFKRDHIAPFDRILAIRKPVIAAVNGWCLGGGCELALSCDLLIASESARFGQPEINLGVIPGAGGTQRLTRAVGKVIAMEMVLNNRTLTAQEALGYGFANRAVPAERCLEEALALAAELAARAPLAIQAAKKMVNHAFDSFLVEGLAEERRTFYNLFDTQDQKEGMQAFSEKRPPEWRGK